MDPLTPKDPLDTEASRPKVLWIGPIDDEVTRRCHATIAGVASVTRAELPAVLGAESLVGSMTGVVLACPRPIADPRPYAELVERFGAERMVQLLGVWCEGEERTGRVLDGVERVFWHAWPRWVASRFALAPTSSEPKATRIGAVTVESADKALVEAIAAELNDQDVPSRWARPGRGVDAPIARGDVWLFDAAQLGGHEADRLADACYRARRVSARVVVMLDFPRPETFDAALAIGAEAVLAKPFGRADLLHAIGLQRVQSDKLRDVA